MNGKERVKATVEFEGPDRLPYLPMVDMRRFQDDRPEDVPRITELMNSAPWDMIPLMPTPPPGSRPDSEYRAGFEDGEDMWGVTWEKGYDMTHPLVDNDFDLDSYPFPDPNMPGLFDVPDQQAAEAGDQYLLGMVWRTLFERMHMLRGFENAMTDYIEFPDKFRELQQRIFEYDLVILEHWISIGVDGVFFSDDWGDNRRLLISPKVWRDLWRPFYKELFGRARENGVHVWLHSCGNVMEIIPDLIDLGLNVLNPVQPKAMDIGELASRFGGKLCFYGGVDTQDTLPNGSPDDVKREVKYLIDTLGCFNGGYIGGVSHTLISDVPMDNIIALYEAFAEYS